MKRVAIRQPGGTWAVDIGATLTVYGQTKQSAEDWAADVEYKIQTFGAVVEALERTLAVANRLHGALDSNDALALQNAMKMLNAVKKGEEL